MLSGHLVAQLLQLRALHPEQAPLDVGVAAAREEGPVLSFWSGAFPGPSVRAVFYAVCVRLFLSGLHGVPGSPAIYRRYEIAE